jgi:hypothetical protein
VTLPLEFTVDPDAQKPGLLDRGNYLLVEVDRRRRSRVGAGEVDKFTLFWSKLHSSCSSPLATDLPGALEVPASRLRILAEREEVQVVGEADCNKARMITELGIETGGVEEEEDRRERWSLWHTSSNPVRRCRLSVEVEAGCTAIEEATDPPDKPEGEPLELEGME